MVLYFAYGANMDPEKMDERGVEGVNRGLACLPHHRICFDKIAQGKKMGWATLIKDYTTAVWGCVWQITITDLEKIDKYEVGYSRRREIIIFVDEEEIQAWIYFAKQDETEYPRFPGLKYISRILRMGEAYHFPLEYMMTLQRFKEKAWMPPRPPVRKPEDRRRRL